MFSFLIVLFKFLFQVTVEAYDTAFPDQRAREDVLIFVERNPNAPIFENNFIRETVSEYASLGSLVVCVTANDADGDDVSYEILSTQIPNNNQIVTNFFYMSSGCIYVRRNLDESVQDAYTFTARARDNAYPEKFGTTTVQINIERDRFQTSCRQSVFSVNIPETTPVNGTQPVINVQATDNDLRVSDSMICFFLASV